MNTRNMIFGLLALITQACGGAASSPTASTDATSAAVNATATQTFTFAQAASICTALKAWDPTKTNIQFQGDVAGYVVYLFTNTSITQNGNTLTSDLLNIGTGGTPVCTVTIGGGKMTTVQ